MYLTYITNCSLGIDGLCIKHLSVQNINSENVNYNDNSFLFTRVTLFLIHFFLGENRFTFKEM